MKRKKVFPILYKKYKYKKDFLEFINKLTQRVKDNNPISENGLLDGYIIGLIHSNSGYIWALIFTDKDLPPMSDNTIQQLENCVRWIANNEKKLNNL